MKRILAAWLMIWSHARPGALRVEHAQHAARGIERDVLADQDDARVARHLFLLGLENRIQVGELGLFHACLRPRAQAG